MIRPLIAICGTTGVGKSKLAVELALAISRGLLARHSWHGARIINADSMQVYKGLDVITNKISESEKQGIEHLLIGFKQPGEQYAVGEWVRDAVAAIDETHHRGQIPIVVGGTSYWIQHLLFPDRLMPLEPGSNAGTDSPQKMSPALQESVSLLPPDLLNLFSTLPEHPPSASADAESAFSLHRLLSILDPPVAARWHWKDTRKVLRNLTLIKHTGKRSSEISSEQSQVPIQPRYPTLCFWLYAEPSSLNPRLDARVDEMLTQGLLDEIRLMHDITGLAPGGSDHEANVTDYTLGIYQSIGYKEFHDFLTCSCGTDEDFRAAVENMKLSTRRYAKRQVSWIRNKLLPMLNAVNASVSPTGILPMPTYLLDASVLGQSWILNVREKAKQITLTYLEQHELPDPFSMTTVAETMLSVSEKPTDPTAVLDVRRKLVCPVCTINQEQPVMIERGKEWDAHQKSRRHRRLATKSGKDGPQKKVGIANTPGSWTTELGC